MNTIDTKAFNHAANIDLAQGRVWDAYEGYTEVLESETPGHPYAFLNRALCLIILGHPALATFDCWRAIAGGKWAECNVKDHLGLCIRTYVTMYMKAKNDGETWTTGCANGEVLKAEGRWLAHPLASFAVRTAPKLKPQMTDFPHARYVILCGYYRLAYALFKCGGGALQSALNMINLATESHCQTDVQRVWFLPLQNHILEHIQGIFKEEDGYMLELHNKGLIELPRDRPMMEDNLMRGLMKSTFTTIPREQYPWDSLSVTTANFDELRPELQEFLEKRNHNVRLDAIRCSDNHPVIKNKVPRLYLKACRPEGDKSPVAIVDEEGIFVWSRKNGVDVSCEGCGALLQVNDDWLPPPDARQKYSSLGTESDIFSDRQTPDGIPVPHDRMPLVEAEETLGSAMSPPPKPLTGRYYANLNAESSRAPRPEGLPSNSVSGSDKQDEVMLDTPKSPPEEYVTPEPGRAAFEERRPSLESFGLPEAGGDVSQGLQEDRKDSLYPNVDDAPPDCPPSPRAAPLEVSFPPLQPSPALLPQVEGSEEPDDLTDLSIRKLREKMKNSGEEAEFDLRTCLGQNCYVFFCSKECEVRHSAAHDTICDHSLEEPFLTIHAEQSTKIGGWWGGMVPTIPRQRVLSYLMKKVMSTLWWETGCAAEFDSQDEEGGQGAASDTGEPKIPLEMPWVRLMDGNLDEPNPIPDYNSEHGDIVFVNDIPEGDIRYLFPGYISGTARPSATDFAQFKSHKLVFSLDTSVIWPLQVLFEMGREEAFFDISCWDGWMLMTLAAKIEDSARIDRFCRFSKSTNARGMIGKTRCVDIPHTVRTNGLQRLQKTDPAEAAPGSFTDSYLAEENELLMGSLHPLTSLIRSAKELDQPSTVRLAERAGDVFVFNWPIDRPLVPGKPLLKADDEVWPFKLHNDALEHDEKAGIGGRWANVRSEVVARWVRRGYQASREDDMEREVAEDSGVMIEELLAGYRVAALGHRGGAARHPPVPESSSDENMDGHSSPVGSGRDVHMEVDNDGVAAGLQFLGDVNGEDTSNGNGMVSGYGVNGIGVNGNGMTNGYGVNGNGMVNGNGVVNGNGINGNVTSNHNRGFTAINARRATPTPAEPSSEASSGARSPPSEGSYWSTDEGEQFVRDESDLAFANGRLWAHLLAETENQKRGEKSESESEQEEEIPSEPEFEQEDDEESGYEGEEESEKESEQEAKDEHERNEHQDGHQDGGSKGGEKEDEEEVKNRYRRDDEGDSDSDEDEEQPLLKRSGKGEDGEDGDEENKQGDGEEGERGETNRTPIGGVVVRTPPPPPQQVSEDSSSDELDLSKLTMYELGH
ncbi:uncharacterized protein J3D65DRAFT_655722 [Phyllosticta citribraziliensis]|uniref:C2H2-type domain-containing protein n=1 Tax=Phyllosticta citribraziliensis TaxID=989973 RepID=A0ABR1M782_9PEZI